MAEIIVISVFILLVFALIVLLILRKDNRTEAWKEVAVELGLSYTPRKGIHGTLNGLEVVVKQHNRREEGPSTLINTFFSPALPDGLKVVRETPILGKLRDALGGKDIQTGDANFDDRFKIQFLDPKFAQSLSIEFSGQHVLDINDPKALMEFFNMDFRAALTEYDQAVGQTYLRSSMISFKVPGALMNKARIQNVIEAQNKLAIALRHANRSADD